ncbi:hypothetical protein HDU76_013832 [Blyttiomyces sp. JEL0837]|nr:hypothetical protein HDU76_013832 [Blyttiomyces sp. JEL0837]
MAGPGLRSSMESSSGSSLSASSAQNRLSLMKSKMNRVTGNPSPSIAGAQIFGAATGVLRGSLDGQQRLNRKGTGRGGGRGGGIAGASSASAGSTRTSLNNVDDQSGTSGGDEDALRAARAAKFDNAPASNRFMELKEGREALRLKFIQEGKMSDPNVKMTLDEATDFIAECPDMCPEFEIHEREFQNTLHVLERIPNTNLADPAKCVKKYKRSDAGAATQLPSDVRPPDVLERTLNYLFHTLIGEHGLTVEVQGFVRDRARSIRNDFTVQNHRGIKAVECNERIARFHILSTFIFSGVKAVDFGLEREQMRKTLQSLREFYRDLAAENQFCPNEPEFQALYILAHLTENHIVSDTEQLREEVVRHRLVQLAIEFQQMAQNVTDTPRSLNFFSKFFRLIADPGTPYLFACILHQEFDTIRRAALRAMHKVYYCLDQHPFLVNDIVNLLGYDDENEAIASLDYYQIPHEIVDGVRVAKIGKIKDDNKFRAQPFGPTGDGALARQISKRIVEAKASNLTIIDILDGKYPDRTLPVQSYPEWLSSLPPNTSEMTLSRIIPPEPSRLPEDLTRNASVPQPFGGLTSLSQPTIVSKTPQAKPATPPNGNFTGFNLSPTFVPPVTAAFSVGSSSSTNKLEKQELAPSPFAQPFVNGFTSDPSTPFSSITKFNTLSAPSTGVKPVVSSTPISLSPQPSGFFSPSQPPVDITSTPISLQQRPSSLLKQPTVPLSVEPAGPPLAVSTGLSGKTPPSTSSAKLRKSPLTPTPAEAKEVFESLVDQEIVSLSKTVLAEDALVRNSMEELIEEVIEDEAHEILFELNEMAHMAIEWDELRVESQAFRFWFEAAKARALERSRLEEARMMRAVNFYKNILESEAGPPVHKSSSLKFTGGSPMSNGVGGNLVENLQVSARDKAFTHLNVPDLVFDKLLANNKPATRDYGPLSELFWKLVVSTPSTTTEGIKGDFISPTESAAAYLNRYVSLWTRSKFGAGGDGSGLDPVIEAVDELGNIASELVRVQCDMWEGGNRGRLAGKPKKRLSLAVSHIEVKGEPRFPLKQNAEALASGVNAAIFQISIYPGVDLEEVWWKSEKKRLFSFLCTFPNGALVPLLIVYWEVDAMSLGRFKELAPMKLDLPLLLQDAGGPAVAVDVVSVANLEQKLIMDDCLSKFSAGIQWLADVTVAQPVWRCNPVKDIVERHTANTLRTAFEKLNEMLPEGQFALDMEAHRATFNTFTCVFNLQVDVLINILASPSNADVAWPAEEFSDICTVSLPPLEWNKPHNLATLERFVKSCYMPLMPVTRERSQSGNSTPAATLRCIHETYESYISRLTTGHGSTSSFNTASALTTDVWNRVAPFERAVLRRGNMIRFPFSKVVLCIANHLMGRIEMGLAELSTKIGGSSELQVKYGPWYDARKIKPLQQLLLASISETISSFKETTLDPWLRESQEILGLSMSSPINVTPVRSLYFGTGMDVAFDTFDNSPPPVLRLEDSFGVSDCSDSLGENMLIVKPDISRPPAQPEGSQSQYTSLKRRLHDLINVTKQEVEASKRRMTEDKNEI